MRFHIPGLPHTVTNKKYCHCAFTQKVYKLCEMLSSLGHEVFHYGCEGSNPVCTEHVDVITDEFRKKYYPDEWHEKQWDYDVHDECHKKFFENAIVEIKKRTGPEDFLLCSWGWGHQPIAAALGGSMMAVEPGIGYKDTFCRFRVFESYNWMSYNYGRGQMDPKTKQLVTQDDGRFFDAVIPNYFDPKDFDYTPDDKEDYFLYLGRVVKRKGIHIAIEIMSRMGGHLKIAGQGKLNPVPNKCGEIIEHVGFVDVEKRRRLLARAKAVIMPTIYIEPFGGVAVEAMMSGTPVISTDWGVFPETVLHGITGYRCRTLEQFEWACKNTENISPEICRNWALDNFSMDRVAQMYQEYFEILSYTREKTGWYKTNPDRGEMKWLDKKYPTTSPKSISVPKSEKTLTKGVVIHPEEDEPHYALNLDWYTDPKNPGISFLMRAKNEERTIGMALDSLSQLAIPYEINLVLNNCEDDTAKIALDRIDRGYPIKIFQYPFQLGKTGIENQCTPVTSVHSTIWLLNWMLLKSNYEYTFRWDSDFIMTSALVKNIEEVVQNPKADIYNISALFSDSGKANREPYLWSNSLRPRYCRYSLWHWTKFGVLNPRVASLNGSIIHDSQLSEVKEYWNTDPWWDSEDRNETKVMIKLCKEKYEKLSEIAGGNTRGRASCPKSEELAKKIQQALGGADTEEIPLLKKHTINI